MLHRSEHRLRRLNQRRLPVAPDQQGLQQQSLPIIRLTCNPFGAAWWVPPVFYEPTNQLFSAAAIVQIVLPALISKLRLAQGRKLRAFGLRELFVLMLAVTLVSLSRDGQKLMVVDLAVAISVQLRRQRLGLRLGKFDSVPPQPLQKLLRREYTVAVRVHVLERLG